MSKHTGCLLKKIFDVSEVHAMYEKLRYEYIQASIEMEFMDPYTKRFRKEGKDLESKNLQLEKAIAMKQKNVL